MKKKNVIILIIIIFLIIGIITSFFFFKNKTVSYKCTGPVSPMDSYSISPYYEFTFEKNKLKTEEVNYVVKFADEETFNQFDFNFSDTNSGFDITFDYENLIRTYTYKNLNYLNIEGEIALTDYLEKLKNINFTCEIK